MDNVLNVQYFGAFSMNWNGRRITNQTRSETHFIYLIQMLLHDRAKGVDRQALLEELYRDREVSNASHSLNVLFYNARKRLKSMGLPDCEYIEKRDGRYYWTSQIPVKEDAAEFESLYRQAESSERPEEKLALYLAACELYTGDFLPSQTGRIWVARESARYQGLFRQCADRTAAYLRETKQYDRLELLGRHATAVQPFSDWEQLTLEALVGLGRYNDAEKLYRETEQRYFQELNVQPNRQMLELHKKIVGGRPSRELLYSIRTQLIGKKGQTKGAFFCSYTIFENICRLLERIADRGGQSNCLMLCSLTNAADASQDSLEDQEALRLALEDALRSSLRQSDVVCRYGPSQYLALLVNAAQSDCAAIQARISAQLHLSDRRSEPVYYFCSVDMPSQDLPL